MGSKLSCLPVCFEFVVVWYAMLSNVILGLDRDFSLSNEMNVIQCNGRNLWHSRKEWSCNHAMENTE